MRPLIITYLNLLHKHRNVNAVPVRNFVRENIADEVFVRRAAALRAVFTMGQALRQGLHGG